MSTSDTPKALYIKYFEEFGVIPDRPEYFINFCKKHGVPLKYKDCRQLFANPPTRTNNKGDSVILSDHSEDDDDEEEELKYDRDKQSPSPATPSPIIYNNNNKNNNNNTNNKTKKFQLLNNTKKTQNITATAVELEVNESNYLSPEILINKMIPLNDKNNNVISYHRDLSESEINKCYLIRDAIFFILYWIGLTNGIFNYFHFNLWYFRFLSLLIWHSSLIIGLLSHIYYKSPPFYSLYRGSDCKYIKDFDISAIQYIKQWNDKQYIGNIADLNNNNNNNERPLKIHLFYIEMYGGLSDSKCGFVQIEAKQIMNKSVDILQDIKKQKKNKLIRLRIYHILRFNDVESYNKFIRILSEKRSEFKRAEKMHHIEYNIDIKERLLMNTTHCINQEKSIWNLWNNCCSNKKMSYFWYIIGCGFIYRLYHDCCIKTQIYDCVKEVTL